MPRTATNTKINIFVLLKCLIKYFVKCSYRMKPIGKLYNNILNFPTLQMSSQPDSNLASTVSLRVFLRKGMIPRELQKILIMPSCNLPLM